jgi:hypothetical protein
MSRAALSLPTPKPAFLVTAIVLLTAVTAFATAPAQAAKKPKPCWERVIDDWLDNGRIDGVYSTRCLEDARRHLPEDIRAYSNVEEMIDESILNNTRTPQGGGGTPPATTSQDPNLTPEEAEELTKNAGGKKSDNGPLDKALNPGRTSADTIPLPLIILAAFALLLLAAGAAGFAQRKLQARKVPPS